MGSLNIEIDYLGLEGGYWAAFMPTYPWVKAVARTQSDAAELLVIIVRASYFWGSGIDAIA